MAFYDETDVIQKTDREKEHLATRFYATITSTKANPLTIKAPVYRNQDADGNWVLDKTVLILWENKWQPKSPIFKAMGAKKYNEMAVKPQERTEYNIVNVLKENHDREHRRKNGEPDVKDLTAFTKSNPDGDYEYVEIANPKQIEGFLRLITCNIETYFDKTTGKENKKQVIKITLHDFELNHAYIIDIPVNGGNISSIIQQLTNLDYRKDVKVKLVSKEKKTISANSNVKWEYAIHVSKQGSVDWRFVSLGENMPMGDINGNVIRRYISADEITKNPSLSPREFDAYTDIVKIFSENPSLKKITTKDGGFMFVVKDIEYAISKNPTFNKPYHETNEECVLIRNTNYKEYRESAIKKYTEMQTQVVMPVSNTIAQPTVTQNTPPPATNADDPNGDLPF